MEPGMTFTAENEEGKRVRCEVLFTFADDETDKRYIVYTDQSLDEEGHTRVFASIFDPDRDDSPLLPIETEREWTLIETLLEGLGAELA